MDGIQVDFEDLMNAFNDDDCLAGDVNLPTDMLTHMHDDPRMADSTVVDKSSSLGQLAAITVSDTLDAATSEDTGQKTQSNKCTTSVHILLPVPNSPQATASTISSQSPSCFDNMKSLLDRGHTDSQERVLLPSSSATAETTGTSSFETDVSENTASDLSVIRSLDESVFRSTDKPEVRSTVTPLNKAMPVHSNGSLSRKRRFADVIVIEDDDGDHNLGHKGNKVPETASTAKGRKRKQTRPAQVAPTVVAPINIIPISTDFRNLVVKQEPIEAPVTARAPRLPATPVPRISNIRTLQPTPGRMLIPRPSVRSDIYVPPPLGVIKNFRMVPRTSNNTKAQSVSILHQNYPWSRLNSSPRVVRVPLSSAVTSSAQPIHIVPMSGASGPQVITASIPGKSPSNAVRVFLSPASISLADGKYQQIIPVQSANSQLSGMLRFSGNIDPARIIRVDQVRNRLLRSTIDSLNHSLLEANSTVRFVNRPPSNNKSYVSILPNSMQNWNTVVVPKAPAPATQSRSTSIAQNPVAAPGAEKKVSPPNNVKITPVFSKPNKIAENFLRRVNKLLPYRPTKPPPELKLNVMAKYQCEGCYSQFLFEGSLFTHLMKRSLEIRHVCPFCKQEWLYLNFCTFIIHLKNHGKCEKKLLIDMSDLKVDLIRSEWKDDSVEIPFYDGAGELADTAVDIAAFVESASSIGDDTNAQKYAKTREMLENSLVSLNFFYAVVPGKTIKYVCQTCSRSYARLDAYRNHFKGKSTHSKPIFHCDLCMTQVEGRCAFKAHSRIHSKARPYVCPQCGEFISGPHDVFLKHLKLRCLHFQTAMVIHCTECDDLIQCQKELIVEHYMTKHMPAKCDQCKSTNNHVTGNRTSCVHADPNLSLGSKTLTYVCMSDSCNALFTSKEAANHHFETKHWPQLDGEKRIKGYKCLQCRSPVMLFEFKRNYLDHLKNVHDINYTQEMCNECGLEMRSAAQVKQHKLLCHIDKLPLLPTDICNSKQTPKEESTVIDEHRSAKKLKPTWISSKSPTASANKLPEAVEAVCNTLPKAVIKIEAVSNIPVVKKDDVRNVSSNVISLNTSQKCAAKSRGSGKKRANKEPLPLPVPAKKSKGSIPLDSSMEAMIGNAKPGDPFIGQLPNAPPPKPQHKCSECTRHFYTLPETHEHLRSFHKVTPIFVCPACGFAYTDEKALERHKQIVHQGKSKFHQFLCYKCLEKNILKGYPSLKMMEKHLSSHHKVSKKHIDYEKLKNPLYKSGQQKGSEVATSQVVHGVDLEDKPCKRLKYHSETTFLCAKCPFSSDDRPEFIHHISRHKTGETSIQCLECGLCFTVIPPLRSHLTIVHRVKDLDSYSRESGVCLTLDENGPAVDFPFSPSKVSQIPNGISTKIHAEKVAPKTRKVDTGMEVADSSECSVCYKHFDDPVALRKHIRMHGMAFIKSRRKEAPIIDWANM